ncbi:MAG TPA: flagellar biosynthesis protein FlhB [Gammaproteobacteria bacterium]
MSEHDSAQERTESATPRRREEARRKGQVPRSRELNTMSVMLAGAGTMAVLGPWMFERLESLLVSGLAVSTHDVLGIDEAAGALGSVARDALVTFAPLFAFLLVAALAGPAALGGLVFSAEALAPKLERLDPMKGLKRIFSVQALVELGKTLLKFAVLAGLSVALLAALADELLGLGRMSPLDGLIAAAGHVKLAFVVLAAGLVVIAAVDVPFQVWNYLQKLKMTRQEVKEELKETEGNPEVRGKIRRLQQQAAQRRMMHEVPLADVVLTNPTHYAVALRYTDRPERAPRVVAKGCDLVAARIRELAESHRVPVCEAPVLTRAIYFNAELGAEIPVALYLAVARVLAYVFELKAAREHGRALPAFPADLPIPEGVRTEPRGAA